jgi:hypothetical protein
MIFVAWLAFTRRPGLARDIVLILGRPLQLEIAFSPQK